MNETLVERVEGSWDVGEAAHNKWRPGGFHGPPPVQWSMLQFVSYHKLVAGPCLRLLTW